MANPAVQLLQAQQGLDGGWGAYPGLPSRTESTALATLALVRAHALEPDSSVAGAAAAGLEWLVGRQLSSGAWPLADEVAGPSWTTALAVLALSHHAPGRDQARDGASWLLAQRGRGSPWWVRFLYFFAPERRTVELDANLIGWSWVEGTFSWVEPTAYAIIALRRMLPESGLESARGRIEEAERLLVDRVCPDGGWNYGNTRVFGEDLWSYPDTTALALLALAPAEGGTVREPGLAALERMMGENDSILSLGLAALTFVTYGRDPLATRTRLRARLAERPDSETRAVAWAALGLLDSTDPLGLGA